MHARRLSARDRKSTRLNSSHTVISYAVFCLNKKKKSSISRKVITDKELSKLVRLQIDHLDALMILVGELVLTRNRILQISSSREDDELTEPVQRLHRLTAALQDG